MSTNQYSSPPETEPLRVQPIRTWHPDQPQPLLFVDTNHVIHHHLYDDDMKQFMFQKRLTPSDVSKLNRLVIPKKMAEEHLPAGADTDSPTGKGIVLDFEDENGKLWSFRYSYWENSRHYFLTRGWTQFVKEKNLEAGDVVLFYKHRMQPNRFFLDWMRRLARKNLGDASEGGNGTTSDAVENDHNNDGDESVGVGVGVGVMTREFDPNILSSPPVHKDNQHLSYYPNLFPHAGGAESQATKETTEKENGKGLGGCRLFGVNLE